ncbi:nodulation-signaling pathway 2 protein-like [Dendrobium catenatum]|uniref:Nodulation-signaling pathway 2 protein n=1 Tax=Dendrobium catenatum TaxID=906689 RepID=A0A2I0WM25_9ASPA|nr:nodulation-signaling pathway 2 protein-like [Dendrobium catenatum]PKU76714.1 Nodulation-signaling pathway 2 protein [Dendrobium catenatum]
MEEDTLPVQISHYFSTTFNADIAWAQNSPATDWSSFSGNGLPIPFDGFDDQIFSCLLSDNPPLATASDEKRLRIFHLLMAAAEALNGPHKQRALAGVILFRLKELLVPTESAATIVERLALHFTKALQSLLSGKGPSFHRHPAADELTALQLMQDMSPYISFGHLTANQAILDAVSGFQQVHIVDFDIKEGLQWPSLIQALVSHKNGNFTSPSLRITAVASGKWSTAKVEETGQRLTAFAASVSLPFSFDHCRLGRNQRFRPAAVRTVKGDAVILNCVLQWPQTPHRTATSVKSFIGAAAAVGACLVTVVEEENDGGEATVAAAAGFTGKFMDEMKRHWAMMEALEEGFPKQRMAREMVEKEILAPRIAAAVWKAYCEEEGEVGEWMAAAGFRRVDLSGFNVSQARMLIKLFNYGYRVEEEYSNKLVLRWKSRRLVCATTWAVPPAAAAEAARETCL